MPGQPQDQIRTQARFPRLTIALLTPDQRDRGQVEVAVVRNPQLRMVM